ncbi:Cytohesin-interacting protein [Varanus komodoensis]|uniref:Cytohesin 1 interacting protein n=1 Tax=Varanus komodoensis TaxID=61221 RepID=A0A8D2LQE5_VARKO|nr:cytohesin-interacting protein [Varanus komodoensis]KAF7248212.1 Cytohesin-interacting protein [Varanus komodoensis]
MSLKRLIQQSRNGNGVGYCMNSTYSPWLEPVSSPPLDNRRTQEFTNSMDSLTKDYKQLALRRMSSLGDSSGPQRKSLTILKEDNETFGFEIQILPFQRQNNNSFEMYSYVCKVKEGSPAFLSGLKSGYILTSINGVSTESLCHKKMADLISASGNLLRLVVVNEALIVKRMELETKLRFLKKTLQEKLVEFQSLCFREQRLANGEVESPLDSIGSDSSNLFGDYVGSESAMTNKARFSSESSCLSRLSSMTVDSEDSFYQACVFEDAARGTFSRQSSTEDDCFLPRDSDVAHMKTKLRRHRSFRMASSGSMSPSSDGGKVPNIFGTLPRKNRSGSIRKRLLNFIPGLHLAVEEEENYF